MHLFHFNRFLNAIVMILLRNNRSIIPPPNVTCKSGFPSDALIPYCIVNYDSYGKSPVSLSDKESQGYLGAYIRTLEITYAFAKNTQLYINGNHRKVTSIFGFFTDSNDLANKQEMKH